MHRKVLSLKESWVESVGRVSVEQEKIQKQKNQDPSRWDPAQGKVPVRRGQGAHARLGWKETFSKWISKVTRCMVCSANLLYENLSKLYTDYQYCV